MPFEPNLLVTPERSSQNRINTFEMCPKKKHHLHTFKQDEDIEARDSLRLSPDSNAEINIPSFHGIAPRTIVIKLETTPAENYPTEHNAATLPSLTSTLIAPMQKTSFVDVSGGRDVLQRQEKYLGIPIEMAATTDSTHETKNAEHIAKKSKHMATPNNYEDTIVSLKENMAIDNHQPLVEQFPIENVLSQGLEFIDSNQSAIKNSVPHIPYSASEAHSADGVSHDLGGSSSSEIIIAVGIFNGDAAADMQQLC